MRELLCHSKHYGALIFPDIAYLRLIDSCITQLKAQGPARTCNESKEEEEEDPGRT